MIPRGYCCRKASIDSTKVVTLLLRLNGHESIDSIVAVDILVPTIKCTIDSNCHQFNSIYNLQSWTTAKTCFYNLITFVSVNHSYFYRSLKRFKYTKAQRSKTFYQEVESGSVQSSAINDHRSRNFLLDLECDTSYQSQKGSTQLSMEMESINKLFGNTKQFRRNVKHKGILNIS